MIKIDKQLIVRNTFVLLATVVTFLASKLFLGADNTILSIVVFLISIFILNKNFTGSPIRVFSKIMLLTLFIGVVPYIANMNIFTGFFINFIAIFSLLYLLVYRLKKTIYFPFLLGYTLLLCVSPSKYYFYLRIGALAIIAVICFLIQITINRKKSSKNKKDHLIDMLSIISDLTDDFIDNNERKNNVKIFNEIVKNWTNEIFEMRNNNFYLDKKEDIELNLLTSLEKLKFDIKNLSKEDRNNINIALDIKEKICILRKFANNEINIVTLNANIPDIKTIMNESITEEFLLYEIYESITIIKTLLIEIKLESNEKISFKKNMHDFYKHMKILKDHFNADSVRFTFAFRTALTISAAYFIIKYFNIHNGSWIIYTIASVSQPYNDTLRKRGVNRVKGTILGAIYFLILFTIFKEPLERHLILMLTIYINSFMKTYDKQITYITLLVLGLASLSDSNPAILSFERIYLVIIGVIITMIAGRLIFPYYISKETEFLINNYHQIGEDIVEKLFNITKFKHNRLEIKNQTLLAKSIENKIFINNIVLDDENLKNFLQEERFLLIKAQSIINRVEYSDISLQNNRDERIEKLNELKKCMNYDYESDIISPEVESYFKNISKTSEKLIYRDIIEMLIILKRCTKLKKTIIIK